MLSPASRVRGSSLLEILVSMLLLSIGMLSMAGLHARAVQSTRTGQYMGVAAQLAADLAERMRANAQAAMDGKYTVQLPYAEASGPQKVPGCAKSTACTGAEMAARDIAQWRNDAQAQLPAAGLYTEPDKTQPGAIDIWVLWQPAAGQDTAASGTSLRRRCPAGVGAAPALLQCLPVKVWP